MSTILSKITKCAKKHENGAHNEEKKISQKWHRNDIDDMINRKGH